MTHKLRVNEIVLAALFTVLSIAVVTPAWADGPNNVGSLPTAPAAPFPPATEFADGVNVSELSIFNDGLGVVGILTVEGEVIAEEVNTTGAISAVASPIRSSTTATVARRRNRIEDDDR